MVSYLTVTQAAQRLGTTTTAVRHWHTRGLIKPVNPGRRPLYFDEAKLQEVRHSTRRDKTRIDHLRLVLDTDGKPKAN